MQTTGYVHATWNSLYKKWEYEVYPYEKNYGNSVLVDTVPVTFTSKTEIELRMAVVAILREKKKEVLADAQKEATEIEGEIQTLLALEDHSND